MPRRYSNEQKDYIRKISPGRYNQEIAELFTTKFGIEMTEGQIKSFKANHKIMSGVPRRPITGDEGLFNKEQKCFIEENVKGRLNGELAALVNKQFGLQITARQMNTYKKNHSLISGVDRRFKLGGAPANKGTKGLYNVGGNRTSFKPGQRARNYKPVGYERVDRNGYVLVKVRDDGPWHMRWRHKHRVLWEAEKGLIPKGFALIFADQDKANVELDNLILVPKSTLSIVNKKGLLSTDPDLTKTGLIVADILKTIGDRKRGEGNERYDQANNTTPR